MLGTKLRFEVLSAHKQRSPLVFDLWNSENGGKRRDTFVTACYHFPVKDYTSEAHPVKKTGQTH